MKAWHLRREVHSWCHGLLLLLHGGVEHTRHLVLEVLGDMRRVLDDKVVHGGNELDLGEVVETLVIGHKGDELIQGCLTELLAWQGSYDTLLESLQVNVLR